MKSKRILSLFLSLVMILSMIPTSAFADTGAMKISSSSDFPSEISADIVYELTSDIVLTSGQQIETLAGTLDGKGHTITLADKPLANNVTGTIQNVGVLTADTLSLSGYSGSMAVTLSGTIQNCYSLANMTTSGWDDIGGLVGTLSGGNIYNSYYAGTNSAMFADGLVGYATDGKIANSCYTVGYSAIGMGGSNAKQTNVSKKTDMTGIDTVTALNTDIPSTEYIWAQDTQNINDGFPILTEDTGDTLVDKTALGAKITVAESLSGDKYTADTWSALNVALVDSKAVFDDADATQAEVNSALSALESAINGLEKKKPTEPLNQDDYTTVKHITSQSELEAIGAGNADTYYILDNDITLDSWYAIFNTFNGVFDGNGKTVTFNGGFTGLFQNIGTNGVVQNVHFAGSMGTTDSGACGTEIQGAVINCYTEISGNNAVGFAKRLNGGVISNCYSVSDAANGAIIAQTETQTGTSYTGTLCNVYWRNDLNQPVDLSKLTIVSEVKSLNASAMKSLDFVAALNKNKSINGVSWGQNSNGYPYFGENLEYTPEDENQIVLTENKTAIAFTSERTQTTTVIENQNLQIDINTALNGIAGLFSLPEYELKNGDSIEWSVSQQSPSDVASIGSEYPYLSVEKEGVLVVTATLVKEDSSTEVLACTKVTVYSNKIEAIKLYLAKYEDTENGEEITDNKATVFGSEDMRILVKALYSGDLSYRTVSENDFTFVLSDPDNIVKHIENSSTFSFRRPGTATLTVTNKNDSTLMASVELTSEYVAVESVKPGISGTIELHGRNSNSSNGENFLPDYANVVVTPPNASYADSYTITSNDSSVAEYVTDMVYGYVPYKAGTVTYTAEINDNGNTVTGISDVTYVYKNPLKNVTVKNNDIAMSVGGTVSAGLIFEGTLTDGYEISETGMNWSFDNDGVVSISRGNGAWKRDTEDSDNGCYFLSNEYTIRALAEGTVTVTGTPVDTTGGAQPISFTVTVGVGENKTPDIYQIISRGIASSEKYLQNQLIELHEDDGVTYGFEWYIIALLRAGKDIDNDILDEYYSSVSTEVKTWNNDVKPTDAERTSLALTILGKDITNIDGVNLSELIYNSAKLTDGSNELAYALLALDAADITIPDTAVWSRDTIIAELLKFQNANGGFGLYDNSGADADMTAICLQALTPYKSDATVASAIEKGVTYLKNAISENYNYANNSNSTAQVLLALASLGVDVTNSDNGFGNVYYNIITALDEYRNTDGNGYLYGDKINSMATVQVMQAYDAYRKAHKENILYWDFDTVGAKYEDDSSDNGSDNDNEDVNSVTVYVTIASDGTIVTDKNGGYMSQAPVNVTDLNNDGKITVDETLYAAHETYYQGGAKAGYSSYNSSYGLSLAILWGKGTEGTSATAGYWLNNASCWSLADEVKDGDYLTAFNYYDSVGYSDAYSYFTENEISVTAGKTAKLTLNYLSGYDENWAPVFSPYSDATVILIDDNNNIKETFTTDSNGQVNINFSDIGEYRVIAYTSDGTIVPAVCRINVTVTVYVTIASDGTIVTDKNGGYMAQAPVNVTDLNNDGKITVDETLYAAHETYYQGGAKVGYSSYNSPYGLSLAILWGKGTEETSATAGYWLNNASCWSLADEVKDGDYLTAFNYYDSVGYSDAYSYFTENEVSVTAGKTAKLTLNYLSGYDDSWAPVFSPYSDANIVFLGSNNGIQKTLTTDENGQVSISFSKSASGGSYYIMAYADNGSIVPTVCKINVTAESSGGSGSSSGGANDENITVYIKVANPKGKTYLPKKAYSIKDGDTVYDLLKKTELDIAVTKSAYGVYVKSIEGLAEFDEGPESGWMYRVNGDFPDYSASLYTLSKGDYVEWLYTRNLGEDIGDNSYKGSSSGGASTAAYTVKFETNGGSTISSQNVAKNGTVTKPTTPTKDGYTFVGWYTDSSFTTEYDFSSKVTGRFTLYAKWTAVENKSDNTDKTNALTDFDDVEIGSWYEEAVAYAVKNNLFKGISDTEFAPNSDMTRAMLVTVLYRLENPKESEKTHNFTDVADGEWYAEAVTWAAENGVVNGVNETEFAPNNNITREQLATIIYRYAKMKGYDTDTVSNLTDFADANEISEYALDAIKWANAAELINGVSETSISPKTTATRIQVAVIFMRFCENIAK